MTKQNNDITLETLDYDFGKYITAFSTLRGNITDSQKPYDGFSVCDYTNDDGAKVSLCRHLLCDKLNIPPENLIIPRQTHSDNIAVISDIPVKDLMGIDALITQKRNVALVINTADCVPVLLADSENTTIAAIHAGWRGIISEIVPKTIAEMTKLGCRKITAVIGPAICCKCFETSNEIADLFQNMFGNSIITTNPDTGKKHVDLPATVKLQLQMNGISQTDIHTSDICTRCNPSSMFSARRLGVNSGRTATVIMLKNI